MKIIVTLGQIAVLSFVAYQLYDRGFPNSTEVQVIYLILTVPALITLYYINFCVIDSASEINKLTHERRLLEEQTKIDKLKSDAK
jgi:ABC-type glycerol-3-phosphate transport system permease component